MNRFMTFVGNVLGTTGKNTVYDSTGVGNNRVYLTQLSIGGGSPDPVVSSSMIRAMNWDSATTTNAGLVSSGFTPADVPPSLLYASKPSYFGNLRWPPIDPTDPVYASSRTNLPAAYRLMLGSDPVTSGNQSPIAQASASASAGPAPFAVTFSSGGSYDPEGTALTYNWVFGDGSVSTAANPSHTYQAPGNYSAQLAVSDGTNTTTSAPIPIKVLITGTNQPPVVAASATPNSGVVPLSVNFSSAGSSDPEGTSLTYNWAFGDGGTSILASPAYTYQTTGTFSAVLTVSDGTNLVSSQPMSISVLPVGSRPSGLAASYGFEEGSGTTVGDVSGNGNRGSLTGATWTTNGKIGRALSFGPGAFVSVPDSGSLDVSDGITLEAWVYPTAPTGWMNILYKPAGSSAIAYVLQGTSGASAVPSFGLSGSSVNLSAPTPLSVNVWSHLAATYDGASMRLFVNGTEVASQPQTGAIIASTDPLSIGGNSFYGENWAGMIDEVRVYNRPLTASEIQADMSTPITVLPQAPTGLRVTAGP